MVHAGQSQLQRYCAYTIGDTGRIELTFFLEAKTDLDAVDEAQHLLPDCALEVWDFGRLVGLLNPGRPHPRVMLREQASPE